MRSITSFLCVIPLIAAQMAAGQAKSAAPANKPATSTSTASVASSSSRMPTEQTVDSFLRAMFGYDPSFTYQIVSIGPSRTIGLTEVNVALGPQGRQTTLYITPDGSHAFQIGEVIPFGADPFRPAKLRLEREAKGPSEGATGSALLLVEFSDLQCPHCKEAQPTIAKLLADFPNARFVVQNFPLSIHPWAFKAASYAQCVGEQNKTAFFKFVDAVFADQDSITEENADSKLQDDVAQAGGDPKQTATCAASPSTAAAVKQSLDLGAELGVDGTPTLFVNGRPVQVGGIPYETLKAIVQFDVTRDK